MREIIEVSPFRCRVWAENGRLSDYINEETCRSEIQSFLTHGQLLPVLGRRVHRDPEYDVELIFGARRLFVARHLNMPLKVEVRDMSDLDAIIALDIENRHRQDISPYERGCAYQSWLRANYFKSQDEIAHTLGVSASQVSRLIKLAQLPPVIVNAFKTPFEICETWAADLHEAWSNPVDRNAMARRARSLTNGSSRLPAAEVFQNLLSGSQRKRTGGAKVRDEVITDGEGQPLFRIRYQPRTVAFLIPNEALSSSALAHVKDMLSDVLQPGIGQTPENTAKFPTREAAQRGKSAPELESAHFRPEPC